MAYYLIELVVGPGGCDIRILDEDYQRPVVVEDRRGGAHDLIALAYDERTPGRWSGSHPLAGEVYQITRISGRRERWPVLEASDDIFRLGEPTRVPVLR